MSSQISFFCPTSNNLVSCLLNALFIASARIQVLKTHIKLLYNLIKHHLGTVLDTLEYITSAEEIACDHCWVKTVAVVDGPLSVWQSERGREVFMGWRFGLRLLKGLQALLQTRVGDHTSKLVLVWRLGCCVKFEEGALTFLQDR